MRPLMLLLLVVPVLLGALLLSSAPVAVQELQLPPRTQWSWAHRLRAAGFSADCHQSRRGASARVATDVASDGSVRLSCYLSGARRLPGA